MTNVQLTYHLYHSWYQHKNVSVIGAAFLNGDLLKEEAFAACFYAVDNEVLFMQQLRKLSGHFAVIIETKDHFLVAVDVVRTFPIFLNQEEARVVIADTVLPGTDWNEKETAYFKKVYCTLENNTLLNNWLQLQAGEYALISKDDTTLEIKTWFHHSSEKKTAADKNKLLRLEEHITANTIRYADNRTILIPLSGGYDSRYILALLKEKDYPKIECFTYGRKDSYEVLIAKNVAEKLNVKWHFIEYTDELLQSFFTPEWNNYSNFNHRFSSLPHEQDFFALLYLKEKELLPVDAVIVNGFCQDIHAGSLIEPVRNFDLKKFIHYKYDIKPELSGYENSWNGYQEWLVKNRLSKFIVNSVRVYEYFGLDFYLPYWDFEWIQFWYDLDPGIRLHQQFYKDHLLNGIFKRTGIDFKKPGSTTSNPFYSLRKIAKSILPKKITEQIILQNSSDEKQDPNNALYLYNAIYDQLADKPEEKDFKINNLHALYFLNNLKENHQL